MNKLARIAELKAQEKAYADQIKEWKSERQALEGELPLGLVEDGGIVAEVKETVRFDAATAKKNLSKELFKAIQVLKADSRMAKEILTGYEYRECQKVTGRSVTFKK